MSKIINSIFQRTREKYPFQPLNDDITLLNNLSIIFGLSKSKKSFLSFPESMIFVTDGVQTFPISHSNIFLKYRDSFEFPIEVENKYYSNGLSESDPFKVFCMKCNLSVNIFGDPVMSFIVKDSSKNLNEIFLSQLVE